MTFWPPRIGVGALDQQVLLGEVDVGPPDRAQLPAPRPGDQQQPQPQRQVGPVRLGGLQQPHRVPGRGRVPVIAGGPGAGGQVRGVAVHPPPLDRDGERPVQDRVDLVDRRRRGALAPVGHAPLVALVVRLAVGPAPALAGRPVVYQARPASAQPAAPAQLGVQLVEHLDAVLDLAQLQPAEHRADDPLDVALVVDRGDQLELGDAQPAVDQVADGGPGLRGPAVSDLVGQGRPAALGLLFGAGGVIGVPVTLGDRVPADRDGDLVPVPVPADVPSGCSHGIQTQPIGRFIGKGGAKILAGHAYVDTRYKGKRSSGW